MANPEFLNADAYERLDLDRFPASSLRADPFPRRFRFDDADWWRAVAHEGELLAHLFGLKIPEIPDPKGLLLRLRKQQAAARTGTELDCEQLTSNELAEASRLMKSRTSRVTQPNEKVFDEILQMPTSNRNGDGLPDKYKRRSNELEKTNSPEWLAELTSCILDRRMFQPPAWRALMIELYLHPPINIRRRVAEGIDSRLNGAFSRLKKDDQSLLVREVTQQLYVVAIRNSGHWVVEHQLSNCANDLNGKLICQLPTIATRRFKDFFEKHRKESVQISSLNEGRRDVTGSGLSPHQAVVQREQLDRFLTALSDEEHAIVSRLYGGGTNSTISQVAEDLGFSEAKVRKLQAVALGKLRATLREGGDQSD